MSEAKSMEVVIDGVRFVPVVDAQSPVKTESTAKRLARKYGAEDYVIFSTVALFQKVLGNMIEEAWLIDPSHEDGMTVVEVIESEDDVHHPSYFFIDEIGEIDMKKPGKTQFRLTKSGLVKR